MSNSSKNQPIKVDIQEADFCIKELHEWLLHHSNDSGAIVSFTGLVREQSKTHQNIHSLHLSTYQPLAIKQAQTFAEAAQRQFNIDAIRIIHRHGKLEPDEKIVFVGCASKHRKAAFMAADFIMDHLKSNLAFWKKEITDNSPNGEWIEPTKDDKDALNSWQ